MPTLLSKIGLTISFKMSTVEKAPIYRLTTVTILYVSYQHVFSCINSHHQGQNPKFSLSPNGSENLCLIPNIA